MIIIDHILPIRETTRILEAGAQDNSEGVFFEEESIFLKGRCNCVVVHNDGNVLKFTRGPHF